MAKYIDKRKEQKLHREIVNEKGSIYSSHPTIRERVNATKGVNEVQDRKKIPAVKIFKKLRATEISLSKYLRKDFRRLVRTLIEIQEAEGY